VADGGYTTNANIMCMSDAGIDFIGSFPDNSGPVAARNERLGIAPRFRSESFQYDEARDKCICPAGQDLHHVRTDTRHAGVVYRAYRASAKICAICPNLKDCHPGMKKQGREIMRSVRLPAVVAFHERMETDEAKAIYKTRSKTAEFPNAWIKEKLGLRQFRTCGRAKVLQETLWASMTYNIQQWIRLVWLPERATGVG